jgi:molybdate transport system ATP-binding protein
MVTGLDAQLGVRRGSFALSIDLGVAAGEVVALLGPNGSGKSTALRALAGLLPLDTGRIVVGRLPVADVERDLDLPPHRRPVGVVFQDYLLFPHLSVLDNVSFGPRARGVAKTQARTVAHRWLERIGIAELAQARPRTLSGGQAQRVALARALATSPGLLLLDEPLAALDARTRLLVRSELRRHLADYGGATVIVTHDPVDASVLADRLVVIEGGQVVQRGTPQEVSRRPQTDYVARLVGLNLLSGRASDHAILLADGGVVQVATAVSGPAYAAFRPAEVSLFTTRPDGSPRNVWAGTISGLEPHGEGVRVEVGGAPGPASSILAEVTSAAVTDLGLVPGRPIWVAVKASAVTVYPQEVGTSP